MPGAFLYNRKLHRLWIVIMTQLRYNVYWKEMYGQIGSTSSDVIN